MPTGPQVRLVFTNRETGAVTEHIGPLPLTLGRSAEQSTIRIIDQTISRRHARLELAGGDLVIIDLNSSNGTFVNGGRVERRVLRPNDRLALGSVDVRWSFEADPELTTQLEQAPATTFFPGFRPERATGPVTTPTLPGPVSPARRVVEGAEAHNRAQGHELDGFLSIAHGFLPVEPPLTALPPEYRAWDALVDQLPALYASLGVRRALENLPVLDASKEALPDRYLFRASAILGVFAHAYQYVQTDPPPALPPSVLRPWQQVSERLGKPIPSVSYIDLFFYNWKLRDPSGPRRLANMELLVPAWRNRAEEVFYLVTTEFAMELTPLLDAMLQAQDAVLAEDQPGVKRALLTMLDRLHHVTQVIYPQIDPNPLSGSHLDLVLWAKTVGTSGVPIFDGATSPAGTAQPQIHALDAFFGRSSYHTTVGQQSLSLRAQMPRHWRELVEALGQVSVRDYVQKSSDLRGLYAAVLDAYIGDRGWMGLHRIKAYGFLEVSFKVGRSVTTGAKFTGLFRDKTWEAIDRELAEVRDERYPAGNQQVYFGRVRRGITTTDPDSPAWTTHLRFDVKGQGIHYRPGDRLGVLAENDEALVRATLRALKASGDEVVHLTSDWQEAIRFRAGYEDGTEVLPLRTLLTFGRIRPVGRTTAKRLLGLSAAGALGRIVSARMEDQWELWDLLELVHAAGFDVTRLWSAAPTEAESICRIVAPEVFRLYSIASAMPDQQQGADTVDLVIGGLTYNSPHTTYSYERRRSGSASHFLRRMTSEVRYRDKKLSLTVVPTPRFKLPDDPSTPVVMFAAGSGVAPFHGFAQARSGATGQNTLFLGLRRPDEFVHPEAFEELAAAGLLRLHAAFSQADKALRFDSGVGKFVVENGTRQRVDRLMTTPEQGAALRAAINNGGHLYVCGSAGFASSVMDALGRVLAAGGEQAPHLVIRRLIADGRLGLDIFTSYRGHAQQGERYEISTLIERNSPGAGYWMVVSGKVYDVSEFIHQHVGGPQIIRHYVGMDATSAYQGVLHHVNSEVDAQLSLYELGHMRRLEFGDKWGVVLSAEGLQFMPLEGLFRAWVRYVYLVVAMENALANDYGFAGTAATAGTHADELTPFKLQFLVEAHRRFLGSYLDGLTDDDLTELWQLTVGLCAPEQDVRALGGTLAGIRDDSGHRLARDSVTYVRRLLTGDLSEADRARISRLVHGYAEADQSVLRALKTALRDGIVAFEQHESAVIDKASNRLLAAIQGALAAVKAYYDRLAELTEASGITLASLPPGLVEEPIPEDRGIPGHGTPLEQR